MEQRISDYFCGELNPEKPAWIVREKEKHVLSDRVVADRRDKSLRMILHSDECARFGNCVAESPKILERDLSRKG
jgi:hypothetical protein